MSKTKDDPKPVPTFCAFSCGARTEQLVHSQLGWLVMIGESLHKQDGHQIITCFADRHDQPSLAMALAEAIKFKLPEVRITVPVLSLSKELESAVIVLTLRSNRYYEMALEVSRVQATGITQSQVPFGIYAPGMARLDIHQVLTDYVRDSTPQPHEIACRASHHTMTSNELVALAGAKKTRPDQLRVVLLANGGYCPFCMAKQKSILDAANYTSSPITSKTYKPRPVPPPYGKATPEPEPVPEPQLGAQDTWQHRRTLSNHSQGMTLDTNLTPQASPPSVPPSGRRSNSKLPSASDSLQYLGGTPVQVSNLTISSNQTPTASVNPLVQPYVNPNWIWKP